MRIIRKIIKNGFYWSFLRVLRRFTKPHNRPIKIIMDAIYSLKKHLTSFLSSQKNEKGCFVAAYDLSSNSVSFDFAFFLAAAESFAIKQGEESFVVSIVRKKNDAFKGSVYSSVVDDESLKWKLDNIIIPLISLYPKCSGYNILPKEEDLNLLPKDRLIYPRFYNNNYSPVMDYKEIFKILEEDIFSGFRATKQGTRYIESWFKEKKISNPVVTITIRNYNFDVARNSNIDEWIKFANWLIKEGYAPIFIPDTDSSFNIGSSLNSFDVFRECCWNLGLRMSVYENSYLNFVTAGPASIAQLNRTVKYISMNMLSEGSQQASLKNFKKMGLEIGANFKFSKWYQILSFKQDNYENILQEFKKFLLLEKENEYDL